MAGRRGSEPYGPGERTPECRHLLSALQAASASSQRRTNASDLLGDSGESGVLAGWLVARKGVVRSGDRERNWPGEIGDAQKFKDFFVL